MSNESKQSAVLYAKLQKAESPEEMHAIIAALPSEEEDLLLTHFREFFPQHKYFTDAPNILHAIRQMIPYAITGNTRTPVAAATIVRRIFEQGASSKSLQDLMYEAFSTQAVQEQYRIDKNVVAYCFQQGAALCYNKWHEEVYNFCVAETPNGAEDF